MNLQTRAILICVATLTFVLTLGTISYLSFRDMLGFQKELSHSYDVIDLSLAYQESRSAELKDKITQAADILTPEFRKKAALDVAQSPTNSNVQHMLNSEEQFRKHTHSQLKYLENRIKFYGAMTILATLFLCVTILIFTTRFVFHPLHDLASKMIDFLNNKYSYQFTVPADHEIGKLHATFNAMAQRVLTQIEDLKSLDKAKSEFLSIASHELRTPLTSIRGSLGLLEGGVVGPMNDAAKNLMHIALNETDRLVRIINELLDLAKIEARQFPLQCQWVPAKDLANKTLSSLKGFADAADVKLEIGEFIDVEMNIDIDRMQQVLTNLLSNAIKFSPKKAAVTLSLHKQEEIVVFEVKDSGRGISPEDQDLIFEKFRQATGPNNPLVKGTGLGLAIAKALVEQHGGIIGVRSRPGEGSTFYFTVKQFRPNRKTFKNAEAS